MFKYNYDGVSKMFLGSKHIVVVLWFCIADDACYTYQFHPLGDI